MDLNIDKSEGISIITACMNREENFARALESWQKLAQVSEIIIVDWSSERNLYQDFRGNLSGKEKFIRVGGETSWILSHAFNLALQFAGYNKIVKADTDIIIRLDFFSAHNLLEGEFITGHVRNARDENEKYLNGFLYIHTEDLQKAGGYNEYIVTYGWDDGDLYERLESQGLKRSFVNNDYLYHIPHSARHSNQTNPWPDMDLSESEISYVKNLSNRILVKEYLRWDASNKKRTFNIRQIDENYFVANAGDYIPYQVPVNIIRECHRKAFIKLIQRHDQAFVSESFADVETDTIKALLLNALKKRTTDTNRR